MKYTFYLIKQKSTEKVYVGCTTRSIPARMAEHRYQSKTRDTPLYVALRESGWGDFEVEIVETLECSKRDSILMESSLIEHYDTLNADHGFNLQDGGNGPNLRVPTILQGVQYLSIKEASRESGVPFATLQRTLSKTNRVPKTK